MLVTGCLVKDLLWTPLQLSDQVIERSIDRMIDQAIGQVLASDGNTHTHTHTPDALRICTSVHTLRTIRRRLCPSDVDYVRRFHQNILFVNFGFATVPLMCNTKICLRDYYGPLQLKLFPT